MRLACVFAPSLPLQAVLRRTPDKAGGAVALAEAPGPRARLLMLNAAARAAGAHVGLTAAQARASCPELEVVTVTSADLAATTAALDDVGWAFAPRIESEPGGRVFLEIGDLLRLHPDEQAVAQGLQAAAARVGLAVRVGIAGNKELGRLATRVRDLAVVPPGGERAFVAPLPVRALDVVPGWDEQARRTVAQWGVRTLAEIAALPARQIALRLGPVGTQVAALAAGRGGEPFLPRLPPDAVEEGVTLDWPVYEIEPLAFILRGLLDRGLARLACRSLGCVGLTLRLKLDPRGHDVRDVPIAAPTREAATLLQLVRLDLARRPPDAAVLGAEVLLLPARVRAAQLDLLRPAGPAPDKLAAILTRLGALLGPENVGAPRATGDYREEAVTLAAAPQPAAARDGAGSRPTLALRRFRPAREIEVLVDRDGPAALRGTDVSARVLVAAGPYRTSAEWWNGGGLHRDHWDVQASDGAVYRLHQERTTGRWYLDGYYD